MNHIKDLCGIKAIDRNLIERIFYVMKNNGSIQIGTDNLEQTINILQEFRQPSISRLFLSTYPPPYFSYDPPSSDYGLKLKQPRNMFDGSRIKDPIPSVRVQSNFDQIEKNRLMAERPDGSRSSLDERFNELKERLTFDGPSDWTIRTEMIPPYPSIPTLLVERKSETNRLESTMEQKKIFWEILKKYYKCYEMISVGSVLHSTHRSLDWSSYATTRYEATEPSRGAKKKNFIQINQLSKSLNSQEIENEQIPSRKRNRKLLISSSHQIRVTASMPYKWKSTGSLPDSAPLIETISSNFKSDVSLNPSPATQSLLNISKSNHTQQVSTLCHINDSSCGNNEIGYRLGHPSVKELNNAQIRYSSFPSATLSTQPFKPFITLDKPLLQFTPRMHFIKLIKINQDSVNSKLLDHPELHQLRNVIVDKPSQEERRFRVPEKIKAGYFSRQTRKGQRKAKKETYRKRMLELKRKWPEIRRRLLEFSNSVEHTKNHNPNHCSKGKTE